MHPVSEQVIRPHLYPGETVLWTGRPSMRMVLACVVPLTVFTFGVVVPMYAKDGRAAQAAIIGACSLYIGIAVLALSRLHYGLTDQRAIVATKSSSSAGYINLIDSALGGPVPIRLWPLGRISFGPAALQERRVALRFQFIEEKRTVYAIAVEAQRKLLEAADRIASS